MSRVDDASSSGDVPEFMGMEQASVEARCSRQTLYRLLDKYGVRRYHRDGSNRVYVRTDDLRAMLNKTREMRPIVVESADDTAQ